jgi:glycerol-3-phosphate dehydrogenase
LKRDFNGLAATTFDVIIVGGGIIGCGIARDSALRGLKTLLLDKDDFAYGTTSRSSRLIHGGLRYLRQFEFGLVRQDMREREVLLKIAPHLVKPLQLLIPLTKLSDRVVMTAGMLLYDILSFDKTLPSRKHFSHVETLWMEPGLEMEGLRGSYRYYDCQVPFAERLCLENAIAAAENGATVLNHAKVTGILKDGQTVTGVQVQDVFTGKAYGVTSRMVVNAAGHWMDALCGMAYGQPKRLVRRTKGIHLLTHRVSNNALVLFAKTDGRLWFVIPWQDYSLIGTTDTNYSDDLDYICSSKADVDYLLAEARRLFPRLRIEDIFYTYAGLRSLAATHGRASNVSRAHKLLDHEKSDGIQGFISVLGGKITGYRAIAEEVTDVVCRRLVVQASCRTASLSLPGAPAVPQEQIAQSARNSGLSEETAAHLAGHYGSRFTQVLELARRDGRGRQPLCPHSRDILAQVWHAVNEESALTASDFLLRRGSCGLERCQGLDAVETVAAEMGRLLGWDEGERQRQVTEYRSLAALNQRFRTQASEPSLADDGTTTETKTVRQ